MRLRLLMSRPQMGHRIRQRGDSHNILLYQAINMPGANRPGVDTLGIDIQIIQADRSILTGSAIIKGPREREIKIASWCNLFVSGGQWLACWCFPLTLAISLLSSQGVPRRNEFNEINVSIDEPHQSGFNLETNLVQARHISAAFLWNLICILFGESQANTCAHEPS